MHQKYSTSTAFKKVEHKNLQMMTMSVAHFSNHKLQQQAYICQVFLVHLQKNTLFQVSLLLILLHLPAHITAHRRCTLDISLWCMHCNKIKCNRVKNSKQILTMLVLPIAVKTPSAHPECSCLCHCCSSQVLQSYHILQYLHWLNIQEHTE